MYCLEEDVVVGTYANRTKYIPDLLKSANKYFPHIPFIVKFHTGFMNAGLCLLREAFIKSGKRYWAFVDDDVRFLSSDVIQVCLDTLVRNKGGAVTLYMTHNPSYEGVPYNYELLYESKLPWMVGYFMLMDSWKVGHIVPDLNTPCPNADTDIDYSLQIRKAGYEIFIAPRLVHHLKKEGVVHNTEAGNKSKEYLVEKWGKFYSECITLIKVSVL